MRSPVYHYWLEGDPGDRRFATVRWHSGDWYSVILGQPFEYQFRNGRLCS